MTTVLLGSALNRFETEDPNATDSSESTAGGMSAPFNYALLDALNQRVVIGDGAMGTMLQAADLTLNDFLGLEGCNEILNDTRPDVLKDIHRAYCAAGADAVETNTFGCNLPNLAGGSQSRRDGAVRFRSPQNGRHLTCSQHRMVEDMATPSGFEFGLFDGIVNEV
jgi:hypothetical protein